MKKLFESWKRYLNEQEDQPIEQEDQPVIIHKEPAQVKPVPPLDSVKLRSRDEIMRDIMDSVRTGHTWNEEWPEYRTLQDLTREYDQALRRKDTEIEKLGGPEEIEQLGQEAWEYAPGGPLEADPLEVTKVSYDRKNYARLKGNYFKKFTKLVDKYEPAIDGTVASFEGRTSPENQRLLRLFLVGTMGAETNGNPNLVNKASKASGITQIVPNTARDLAKKHFGISRDAFKTMWRAGEWKNVDFMLQLTAHKFINDIPIVQKQYQKYHPGKTLKGEDLLDAMHIFYSHRRPSFNKIMKKRFSQLDLKYGQWRAARRHTSKAHQYRSYYQALQKQRQHIKDIDSPIVRSGKKKVSPELAPMNPERQQR